MVKLFSHNKESLQTRFFTSSKAIDQSLRERIPSQVTCVDSPWPAHARSRRVPGSGIHQRGTSRAPEVIESERLRSLWNTQTTWFRPRPASRRIGLRINRSEPNTICIKLRISLDDRRWPIAVRQHVCNVVHREAGSLEDRCSAEHFKRAGHHAPSLGQQAQPGTNRPRRGPGVYDDHVGTDHRLSWRSDRRRHDRSPSLKRQHVRGVMRESEADKTLWRQEPRLIAPLQGCAKKARIDDAVHLPQWHAGDRGRLICSRQGRGFGSHSKILPDRWKDIGLPHAIRHCAGLPGSLSRAWFAGRSRSRPIPGRAIVAVSGLRFLLHPRPGTAEVSLRHIFGWVSGGCRSSNLTVNNAVIATLRSNGTAIRSRQTRCPQCERWAWSRMAGIAFLYARVSVPSRVKPGLLHGPMSATFSP